MRTIVVRGLATIAPMVRYAGWFDVWTDFPETVRRFAGRPEVARVCDLGGGANPILTLEEIGRLGLRYEVVDVSPGELAKTPEGYATVQADALDPAFGPAHGPYDLITSGFVAEHMPDPARFHANVRAALAPGGFAIHAFPTLYEPAFVANRLLPERVADPILRRLQGGREAQGAHGKFHAYYRWCRGPSRRQLRRLRAAGFEVVEYVGYFGHGYFGPVKPLDRLEQRLSEALERRPVAALTSYACVVLRRPA
jgi:2-polyprenyl-3-methyl-5-hydroxy-6-metoxy-1,4-benzoquinol methylase